MDRILGQQAAIETLQAGLRSGRLHHGWIFSGPRGVGKFSTAVELSKILLDPAGERYDPDGETARRIDAGSHPDLHVVRKELALYSADPRIRDRKLMNIPLDVLREYVIGGQTNDGKYHEGPAYRTPALGRGKVFIIDEAELIDVYGQNALLKTLEEPPPGTYLFLITSRPQRLLPTVRSRCQHARFGPLDDDAMAAWFARSGLELALGEQDWIQSFCHGAPGIAQIAAEYGFHAWQTTLDPMLEAVRRGVFPAAMGETMAELIDAFAKAWVESHDNASKDAANKDGARFMLSLLADHARRGLTAAIEKGSPPDAWLAVTDLIAGAERQLAANVNLKLVFEDLAAQWLQASTSGSTPFAATS